MKQNHGVSFSRKKAKGNLPKNGAVNDTTVSMTSGWISLVLPALLLLYLAFPDKVYVFDGIMFSKIIERRLADWPNDYWNRHHLLFIPFMMILRDCLALLHVNVAAYPLIQRVNASAGVLGIWLYYRLLARLTENRAVSGLCALALGISFSYWCRATEGQVYMLMTFGSVGTAYAACALLEKPGTLRALALALTLALAFLFHAVNAVLLPLAVAALALNAQEGRRRESLAAILCLFFFFFAPYVRAFHLANPASFLSLLWASSDFGPQGNKTRWMSFLHAFVSHGDMSPPSRAAYILRSFFFSLVAGYSESFWAPLCGASLCLALVAAWRFAWPRVDANSRRAGVLLAIWGAGFAFFESFWLGAEFFLAPVAASFLALIALPLARILKELSSFQRRSLLSLLALMVLGTGAWNLWGGIMPRNRLENNVGYKHALFVKDHTAPTCWVLVSGLGFGNTKVYLTEFANRSTQILELYLLDDPKAVALAKFRDFVQNGLRHGVPLYVLSDLIEDKSVEAHLKASWGVTFEDVKTCFGPGLFLPIAPYDDKERLFLFIPESNREAFYAGLAFNMLDTSDPALGAHLDKILELLGAQMSPDSRRRTWKILQETRYGAALTFQGVAPYLTEEARRSGQEYVRAFMQAPTPDALRRLEFIRRRLGY